MYVSSRAGDRAALKASLTKSVRELTDVPVAP